MSCGGFCDAFAILDGDSNLTKNRMEYHGLHLVHDDFWKTWFDHLHYLLQRSYSVKS
jgi:hypothetical protein